MKKAKIDAAIMALLFPDEPDGIGPDYISALVDEFERRRANYPRDVADWFADTRNDPSPGQVVRSRAVYLDRLLAFRPDDMKAALGAAMYGEEDYGRAAALLLHGHQRGFWKLSECEITEAHGLADLPSVIAQPLTWKDLDAMGKTEPSLDELEAGMQSIFDAQRKRRESSEDTVAMVKRLHPTTVAANKMRAVIADPATTPEQKIDAIRRWLDALEEAGEHAMVLEFCTMGRIALSKVEARRKGH